MLRIFLTLALLVSGWAVPAAAAPQTGAAQLEITTSTPAPSRTVRRESVRPRAAAQPQRRQAAQRASANRTDGYRRWINYGADKSYNTREEAIADADDVMRRHGWSDRVAREMQRVMQTEECDENTPMSSPNRIQLQNGDRADAMRSGGARQGSVRQLWGPTIVAFAQPIGIVILAKACRWTRTIDGVVYTIVLPDICFNTMLIRGGLDCDLIDVDAAHPQSAAMLWGIYEDDQCLGVRRISRVGEPEAPDAAYGPLTTGGCDRYCSLAHIDRLLGRRRVLTGQHRIQPGVYRVRVRRGQTFAVCIETPGSADPSSFGNIVAGRHFNPFGNSRLAIVHAVPRNDGDVRNADYLVNWGRTQAETRALYERTTVRLTLAN